ncbi:MAG: transcriptional regulator [Candidatus Krumholzibacteriota bacterium]|nr:transcriptional regulator [Candidatus Krumholzibacteriota bacterium]
MNSAKELTEIFCEINNPSVMRKFFREIFTPAEIDDFVLRWRLMKMLHASVPQRKIASKLGISLCKITRGARVLRDSRSVTLKILKDKIGDT